METDLACACAAVQELDVWQIVNYGNQVNTVPSSIGRSLPYVYRTP